MTSIRIQITKDVEIERANLCEPGDSVTRSHVSQCTCGRYAFRNVGDDPWVGCVCGVTFNTNNHWIGNVV